jgi:hypothetical protein
MIGSSYDSSKQEPINQKYNIVAIPPVAAAATSPSSYASPSSQTKSNKNVDTKSIEDKIKNNNKMMKTQFQQQQV